MDLGHLYIYGDIYNDQSDYTSEYGIVSLKNIMNQFQALVSPKALKVHIHSRGGDVQEGFAIYDFLINTGLEITTSVEGLCASIATVPALAGSKREMTENSEFFIHNPWGEPWMMNGYTAEDYDDMADNIRAAEEKILDFYVKKTEYDREELSTMMKEETSLSADKARDLGFITDVIETVKAAAFLGNKKPNKQKKNSISMKGLTKLKAAYKAMKDVLNLEEGTINALDLTLGDGDTINVDTEAEEAAVGDAVTINDETPADGDYVLSDGVTFVVASGAISEIKPAEEESEEDETVEDLKAQIVTLNKEKDTLQGTIEENEGLMNEMSETMEFITKNVKPGTLQNLTKKPKFNRQPTKKEKKEVDHRQAMKEKEAAYKEKQNFKVLEK